ncbi:hypothetical protein LR48_Vigan07g173100 [Vigna angularis]|uniref:Retrotransposon gag domain-containing protein n=1 Tax=Phaseolus angularis TaxID=3914 RepID=A0A0L9UZM5_PHAAN|nr:hypothetical protein LR48_Vigan07g173100 [Vigna angularis]
MYEEIMITKRGIEMSELRNLFAQYMNNQNECEQKERRKDERYSQARKDISFFGKDISALTYLAWERKIDKTHPFLARDSESFALNIYLSRLEEHASEWWSHRQYSVKKGRKSSTHDWYELRACMRRNFVPPSAKRDLELMGHLIQEGKTFTKGLDGFSRREIEFKEKLEKLLDKRRKRDTRMREEELREKIEEEKRKREEEKRAEDERREKEKREKEHLLLMANSTPTIQREPKREVCVAVKLCGAESISDILFIWVASLGS